MSKTTNEAKAGKPNCIKLGFTTFFSVGIRNLGTLIVLTITALFPYLSFSSESCTLWAFLGVISIIAFVINSVTLKRHNANRTSWPNILGASAFLVLLPPGLSLFGNWAISWFLDNSVLSLSFGYQIAAFLATMTILLFASFSPEAIFHLAEKEGQNP